MFGPASLYWACDLTTLFCFPLCAVFASFPLVCSCTFYPSCCAFEPRGFAYITCHKVRTDTNAVPLFIFIITDCANRCSWSKGRPHCSAQDWTYSWWPCEGRVICAMLMQLMFDDWTCKWISRRLCDSVHALSFPAFDGPILFAVSPASLLLARSSCF